MSISLKVKEPRILIWGALDDMGRQEKLAVKELNKGFSILLFLYCFVHRIL